jgi:hypothetical protein
MPQLLNLAHLTERQEYDRILGIKLNGARGIVTLIPDLNNATLGAQTPIVGHCLDAPSPVTFGLSTGI